MNTKQINDTLKSQRVNKQLVGLKEEQQATAVKMLDAKAKLNAIDAKLVDLQRELSDFQKQLAHLRRLAHCSRK